MILISDIPSSDQIEAGLLIRGVLEAPTRGVLSKKKGVLRNFAKFTGKNLCQIVPYTCFPVNFAKFLRKPFLRNTF